MPESEQLPAEAPASELAPEVATKKEYEQFGGRNYYRNIEFIKSELSLINNFMMYTLSKCIDNSLELNITTNNIYKLLKQYTGAYNKLTKKEKSSNRDKFVSIIKYITDLETDNIKNNKKDLIDIIENVSNVQSNMICHNNNYNKEEILNYINRYKMTTNMVNKIRKKLIKKKKTKKRMGSKNNGNKNKGKRQRKKTKKTNKENE
tara:strand:- start:710 stop:1324 length:615 start_codon:yes stop_codon:yes gene_type:complete